MTKVKEELPEVEGIEEVKPKAKRSRKKAVAADEVVETPADKESIPTESTKEDSAPVDVIPEEEVKAPEVKPIKPAGKCSCGCETFTVIRNRLGKRKLCTECKLIK